MANKFVKKGNLKFGLPVQGWKQFLASRKVMLDNFDKAKIYSKGHKVETSHGNDAEAEFRKWLSNFLPKRYAVTSGYIISSGIQDKERFPHFDVIIYDYLNSPILWIEDSPDKSKQGASMAIPAEYVKGVIEVKSAFNNTSVNKGIKHLSELKNLMSGFDSPEEKYKKYLPKDFFCCLAFFELRENDKNDTKVLTSLFKGYSLRNFLGCAILRGEGHKKEATGQTFLRFYNTISDSLFKNNNSLLNGLSFSKYVKLSNNSYATLVLIWAEHHFSGFAFEIVALLNGTYEYGKLSSLHALGGNWKELK